MRLRFLLISLLVLAAKISAQTPVHKVFLNTIVQDEKGKKMQAIVAVYKYTGPAFEDPSGIGVETKKEAARFAPKLPNMQGISDTSYAYIFFGALQSRNDLKGYTLMLIGNNQRSYNKPALLWIDKNHNLDLSDDGAPDTFASSANEKDITLINPSNKNAKYTINLSRFSFSYNSKYLGMLDDFYKENSGKKKFVGALYSFKEMRLNTIAGDLKFENDSFRIGLKDVNCNGLYNDEGIDQIIVGDYQTYVLPDNPINVNLQSNKTWFERNGKRFYVNFIEPLGAYMSIQEDKDAKTKSSLVLGSKLKKFKFLSTDKTPKKISIKKYKKKPLYIYVWRFDQAGFTEDTAALRIIARDYADRIQLITLNYGEKPTELKSFNQRNLINWFIGQSTQKINESLFLDQFPLGLLMGKRLKIKQVKISPADLLNLLKNQQI